jgi:hypothetical protein
MLTTFRRLALLCAAAVLTLTATAATAAAAAPSASTDGAQAITSSGARLVGSVNPNGEPTTYWFEYGTTRRYGSRTPDASAGRGTSARRVTATLSGLQPNTTYNFRLVASNPSGVVSSANRTFRTRRQPLGLQIAAAPNPVTFGSPSAITGALTGTGNANRQVVLQTRTFPYTGDWQQVGNAIVTDANGAFAFPLIFQPNTAQFRVRTTQGSVVSDVLTLGVAVRVKTNVSATRVTRGRSIRFSGTIRPARAGAQFAVQKMTSDGRWVVVGGSITRGGSPNFSGFSKRVRVPRGGRYRVFVSIVDGNLQSGIGRTISVSTRR